MSHGVVAVVLSGCGVYDGSEVHESSAVCVELTRRGVTPEFFAPDEVQHHEVNHVTGEAGETKRNALIEAGRIARGKVRPLSELTPDSVDAVIFPGGFGAAKNLSTFAVSSEPEVNPEVARILREFHKEKKVIGMSCIAPIIAAIVLSKNDGVNIKITLGMRGENWPYDSTIEKAEEMGAEVVEKAVNELCVDEENLIVTTPAFMYDGKFHEVFDGMVSMVGEVLKLSEKTQNSVH